MLSESAAGRIYLACGATDMRKSIDSLAALVTHSFDEDPFSDTWFVFCNRGRDKLKLLRWDHNGFWLYYRRLEKGRFEWPASDTETERTSRVITHRQLAWLLAGLSLEQRLAHGPVTARVVI
jgi:transposase